MRATLLSIMDHNYVARLDGGNHLFPRKLQQRRHDRRDISKNRAK